MQAYEEGAGRIDVVDAWKAFRRGAAAHEYTVKAPVDTALDQALKTPGFGTVLYDREGGLKAGQKKTYDITLTRTSGPDHVLWHTLRLVNNAGHTFRIVGPSLVNLPLNQPVTVRVQVAPASAGIKSAVLTVDDPFTVGVDSYRRSATVAGAAAVRAPAPAFQERGAPARPIRPTTPLFTGKSSVSPRALHPALVTGSHRAPRPSTPRTTASSSASWRPSVPPVQRAR